MDIRIKTTRTDGKIHTMDIEEYLRGVVPAEMYATWPTEALKAQAVAARTYAMKKIQDRKNKEYDVDDTTTFQAYVPSKIKASTDNAVKETKGVWISYKGKPIDAVYSSSNGGRQKSAKERWGGEIAYLQGKDDPYDTHGKASHSVGLSQHGAKGMADAGKSWQEIIHYYYTGVTIEGLQKEIETPIVKINQCIFTENNCYKTNRRITPSGVMWHSTGANNKTLKRYLAPDDGIIGKNQYNNHWNQPQPGGRSVCVHAFIGTGVDNKAYIYQTLPWEIEGWHSGSGTKGSANKLGYIGFEICEDNLGDKAYFEEVYELGIQLTTYLCKTYNIPVTKVICHSEGYSLGIASNHADVMHWFPKFGKSMDSVRSEVARRLKDATKLEPTPVPTPEPTPTPKPETSPEIAPVSIIEYRVVKGDSLSKIAQSYNTTVSEILKLNPQITDANLIYINQIVKIPNRFINYIVKKGDNLTKIAAMHKTTVNKILQDNPQIKNKNIIYVGQVIKIYNKI